MGRLLGDTMNIRKGDLVRVVSYVNGIGGNLVRKESKYVGRVVKGDHINHVNYTCVNWGRRNYTGWCEANKLRVVRPRNK